MPLRERLSIIGGMLLRGAFAALAVVRRPRPIHPHGVALEGTVRWTGSSQSGIRWVDEPPAAPQRVTGRASRSVGLPAPAPDVVGLALRFETPDGDADLELASTGAGVPGRFLLTVHGSPSHAHLGTLFPYLGRCGPVLLAARTIAPADLPVDPTALADRLRHDAWRLRLFAATPRGRWHPFAEVELRGAGAGTDTAARFDTTARFDAGRRLLPGARLPGWVRLLRQPSYDRVQRGGGTPT